MNNSNKSKKIKLKGKRRKPLAVRVADNLIKQYDFNQALLKKKVNKSILDLFN